MPVDLLDGAAHGTRVEWIVLVFLLPLAGRAVAKGWGPAGTLAAQRALLLVSIDLAVTLAFALPLASGPTILAVLPLVGAALSRERPDLTSRPGAWAAALLWALPILALAHLGPRMWPALWFIGLFSAALVRGIGEPMIDRFSTYWIIITERIARHRGTNP